jgi:hypothetical protein
VLIEFGADYWTVGNPNIRVPQRAVRARKNRQGKVELIAAVLTTKKLATLASYSLLDLLKDKERYAGSKANSCSILFAEWRESQEQCADPQGVS